MSPTLHKLGLYNKNKGCKLVGNGPLKMGNSSQWQNQPCSLKIFTPTVLGVYFSTKINRRSNNVLYLSELHIWYE